MTSSKKLRTRTQFFFERLYRRINLGKKEGIYRVSGKIRSEWIKTLRIRRGHSRPGNPPHAHTRGGLRVIKFHVDGDSSIVGPVKFTRSNLFNEPAPHIHEFGKTVRSRFGRSRFYSFPKRPHASRTLERLRRTRVLGREFSVSVAKYF